MDLPTRWRRDHKKAPRPTKLICLCTTRPHRWTSVEAWVRKLALGAFLFQAKAGPSASALGRRNDQFRARSECSNTRTRTANMEFRSVRGREETKGGLVIT